MRHHSSDSQQKTSASHDVFFYIFFVLSMCWEDVVIDVTKTTKFTIACSVASDVKYTRVEVQSLVRDEIYTAAERFG
jgi:hypothetical protein